MKLKLMSVITRPTIILQTVEIHQNIILYYQIFFPDNYFCLNFIYI